jgi:3-hydroxyisobutyrate dehydrogenase-like beta-hydroxyacid dehydrogenase
MPAASYNCGSYQKQESGMAKLGFLGLGIMGYPMARNLLRAGHEVALWSHSAEKAKELAAAEKGRFCATPKEVAQNAECIFLCVGDTAMSEQANLGSGGLIDGVKSGSIVADASTISPSGSRKIGAAFAVKGAHYMDVPCTGSTPGANAGTLTFMVGGDQAILDRIRPWMEAMGKKIYYCGALGMGLQAKLSQNLILSNLLQGFNEGMVLATKGGVDPQLMLEILTNSAAKSGLIDFKAPYVFRRDFSPQFSVKWMDKDIGLMLDSGKELNVPLPLTGLTRQMFQAAIATGHGEEDICSTIKVLESIAGVEVHGRKT